MMGGPDGVIRLPAGNGRFSSVALDDVARVARGVLLSPEEHAGQTYDLTGPEELNLAEAAAIVTEMIGQPIHYVERHARPTARRLGDRRLVTSYLAMAAGHRSK